MGSRARGTVVADTGLGVLTIDGADAADFLQGQLSTDIKALVPGRGRTTYNSPKGRMLATAYVVHDPGGDAGWALLSGELAQSIAKRLAMFVLRARATVSDASASYRVFGVGGPSAPRAIETAFCVRRPWCDGCLDGARIAHLPDGRLLVVVPTQTASLAFDRLARHATAAGSRVRDWLVVQSGVPMITPATQDQFVAQAGNFDALGGIDFRKGCYTGQEIVARMQYLGRLKERLFAFRAAIRAPRARHTSVWRHVRRPGGRNGHQQRAGARRRITLSRDRADRRRERRDDEDQRPDGPDATREPCHTRCPTRNRRAGASGTGDGRALLRLVPRTRRRRGRARRSTH